MQRHILLQAQPLHPSQLTPEYLWGSYGEHLTISRDSMEEAWHDADNSYPEWPYHNKTHAYEVTLEAMRLGSFYLKLKGDIDMTALAVGSLYHDSLFAQPIKDGVSKEQRSAEYFEKRASELGLREQTIRIGSQLIRSTERNIKPLTDEDKIEVCSDMANIAMAYGYFLEKNHLIKKEVENNIGTELGDAAFGIASIEIIKDYIKHDLWVAEDGIGKDGIFKRRAIVNLRDYTKDMAKLTGEKYTDLLERLGDYTLVNLLHATKVRFNREPNY